MALRLYRQYLKIEPRDGWVTTKGTVYFSTKTCENSVGDDFKLVSVIVSDDRARLEKKPYLCMRGETFIGYQK